MTREAPNIDLHVALISELERVRFERSKLSGKIEQLQLKIRKLRNHESDLQNQIYEVQIQQPHIALPTTAQPSPKNLDFLRAWAALQAALSKAGPDFPLSHHACGNVIRQAVPRIPDPTIRSHLHRLKKRGFIEKVGGSWRLTPVSNGDVIVGGAEGHAP